VRAVIEQNLERLLAAATGSTFPNVGRDLLLNFEVEVTSPERATLANDLIVSLEDKIESNRQTNQTLEQIAQVLFKSWFVDFDPVKAKIETVATGGSFDDAEIAAMRVISAKTVDELNGLKASNPEAFNKLAETASLFPEKLVESELGLIPDGWDISPLSNYINIKHGFAFKGAYFSDQETDDICVTPGNFRIGGGIKLDKLKYYDGPIPGDYIFTKGELMVTMTDLSKQADTLGYPAFVPESEGKTYLHNQRIGKVELKTEQDIKNYLYSFFCSSGYRNEVLGGVTGSTVKHTAPKKIMAIEVALDLKVADKFSQLVAPLFEKKAQNLVDNSYLEKLRDTLLPKLLSGEIDLSSEVVV
jgi:type I restriction enzyme S subunit